MNRPLSLSDRVAGLRHLQNARGSAAISAAEPLAGDWGPGCLTFPASYAQSRLWFLHQLNPDLTAYHLPAVWCLNGNLDLDALRLALSDLIDRHPPLRTAFRLQGSEVLQIMHPPAPLPLDPEPCADRSPDAVIAQWLEQEGRTPFDLSAGLLLRARLLAVDHQQHWLLLNHHHIASDGWSFSVLARDLTALYNARCAGRSPDLQPLRVQYQDYAVWQQQCLSDVRLQQLRDYWIPQLSDLEPLELPSDHTRSAQPSQHGSSVSLQAGAELLAPFEALCRSEQATLHMGLLAIVALLLHRYSSQDDLAIAIPSWGRNHPDLEPLIGFFINILPIRTRFDSQQSFRQLLRQVRHHSLAAYEHADLPFEQIVDAVCPQRDASLNPLVQVVLQLLSLEDPSLNGMEGISSESLPCPDESVRFELELYLRRTLDGGLTGKLVYATDLFRADRMQRLVDHLLTLMAGVVSSPDLATDKLNLLTESEALQISAWEAGPAISIPELGVQHLFAQQVGRTPDATALVFQSQELTYAQLHDRADQLAQALTARGVGPEVLVAVQIERSLEMIVALLAILKAGGAYLPLEASWPRERQELMLRQAGCLRCLCQPPQDPAAVADDWQSTTLAMAWGTEVIYRWREPADPSAEGLQQARATTISEGRRLAYICYTSGTSGVPKGVEIEHRAILRLVHPANGFVLGAGSNVLQLAPLAFDAATLEIWGPLLNGGTLVVAPPGLLSLIDLAVLIRSREITTLWLSAGLFHAMVEHTLDAIIRVRQTLAGGEALAPEHVNRFVGALLPGHELIIGYGPTENTTFTCCHLRQAQQFIDPWQYPIGRPIAATTVRVLDGAGMPCPVGIPGELHAGGLGLARGYCNDLELTASRFVSDPNAEEGSSRLYRTGDLVSWHSDGTLMFHGRIDNQIKLRGFRIEPGEIEAHLLLHPAVADAVVVLCKAQGTNAHLVAYWVARAEVTEQQLRDFLKANLPDYMIPAAIIRLPSLPLTANGKVDRRSLPASSFAAESTPRLVPASDLESTLHTIWATVLGHADFGVHDHFFLKGGDSLLAMRLAVVIEQQLAGALPVSAIFRFPTIAAQARVLNARRQGLAAAAAADGAPRCLVALQPDGSLPALYAVHGWAGGVEMYAPMARGFFPDRPVFGVQAPEDAISIHDQSVEKLAAIYAQEIALTCGEGPIHLIGYSAGGWYAYALADQLIRKGVPIGLLVLLDTSAISRVGRWTDFYPTLLKTYHPPHSLPISIQLLLSAKQSDNLEALRQMWSLHASGGVSVDVVFEHHEDFYRLQHQARLADIVLSHLQAFEAASCH